MPTGALSGNFAVTGEVQVSNSVSAPQRLEMFIGSDKDTTVTMTPAVDTTGWTVQFNMRRLSSSRTAVVTKSCTVGGGASENEITFSLVAADTVNLAEETYSWEVIRTDSGSEDVLAYGPMDLVYPKA